MKTIKYLLPVLVLFLSANDLFAKADGTRISRAGSVMVPEIHIILPEIPGVVGVEVVDLPQFRILLADPSERYAPVVPKEADFDEVLPAEENLSPVVPMEAPFSEVL